MTFEMIFFLHHLHQINPELLTSRSFRTLDTIMKIKELEDLPRKEQMRKL